MSYTISPYQKELTEGLQVRPMQQADAEQCEELQHIVFPQLADEEILHAPQYSRHLEIFPEGQYVITDGLSVIASTSTMRYNYDPADTTHHTFFETMGGGWLTTHVPNGNWLYGLDMGVHPAYRGKGLAKVLYRARQHTCLELNLKGQMMVGMLNGYLHHSESLSIDAYYDKIVSGELFDPTVSVQIKIGFEIQKLMKEYLSDPTCGNAGALLMLPAAKVL